MFKCVTVQFVADGADGIAGSARRLPVQKSRDSVRSSFYLHKQQVY